MNPKCHDGGRCKGSHPLICRDHGCGITQARKAKSESAEAKSAAGEILALRKRVADQNHARRQQAQGTEGRVCCDIAERQRIGIPKYKTTVEANPLSLREWLTHAYQEALDMAVYLKRAIEELDKKQTEK